MLDQLWLRFTTELSEYKMKDIIMKNKLFLHKIKPFYYQVTHLLMYIFIMQNNFFYYLAVDSQKKQKVLRLKLYFF